MTDRIDTVCEEEGICLKVELRPGQFVPHPNPAIDAVIVLYQCPECKSMYYLQPVYEVKENG